MINEKQKQKARRELAKAIRDQEETDKQQDISAKKFGAKYKVDYWIHPTTGDDYNMITYFAKKPTKQDIKKLLVKSLVKTDFSIIKLK